MNVAGGTARRLRLPQGEAGYRGVSPMSAELVLWLPGSAGWTTEWAPGEV